MSLHDYPRQEQDWKWVLSDYARVEEFIAFYRETPLSDEARFSLMEIILDTYNRWVWNGAADPAIRMKTTSLLEADLPFFRNSIRSNVDYSDSEMEHTFGLEDCLPVLTGQTGVTMS